MPKQLALVEYTSMQKAFLLALAGEAKGDVRLAMDAAGYSKNTAIKEVVSALKDEILEISSTILAVGSVKASLGLIDVLDKPGTPGAAVKVAAAKEVLDRVGLGKKEDASGTHIQTQNIYIMPPKDTKTIELRPNLPVIDQSVVSNVEDNVELSTAQESETELLTETQT